MLGNISFATTMKRYGGLSWRIAVRELTVGRAPVAGSGGTPQPTDRPRFSPLSDVRVEPGHRVFAESPTLWEVAGQLEAVDRHAGQAGDLHYLRYAKKFHLVLPVICRCTLSAPRALEIDH